jgi:leucyl aminopeptidase
LAVEFSTKVIAPEKLRSPALVVGVYEGGKLSDSAQAIERSAKGLIGGLFKSRDIDGKRGTTRVLY